MMNMKQKSKYKLYGFIYSEQCVNCAKEGTYKCAFEVEDCECLNFKAADGDCQFGGY